jgi:hypothetical protein
VSKLTLLAAFRGATATKEEPRCGCAEREQWLESSSNTSSSNSNTSNSSNSSSLHNDSGRVVTRHTTSGSKNWNSTAAEAPGASIVGDAAGVVMIAMFRGASMQGGNDGGEFLSHIRSTTEGCQKQQQVDMASPTLCVSEGLKNPFPFVGTVPLAISTLAVAEPP